MDEVFEAIMEARTEALKKFLAGHDITMEDLTDKYIVDIDTLANGDEKVVLYEKVEKGSTVLTYKVALK